MAAAKSYSCNFTNVPVSIDGLLDDPVWETAQALEFRVPATHAKPKGPSHGRVLWDDRYLYVGIKAEDKDIWGHFTARDSRTCEEDVLEVFLKPHRDRSAYYNFEINPLGTVYDAFNVRRGAGGGDHHRWSRWDCEGLVVGVDVKGSINDWRDVDEYWSLEVAIPFASLPTLEGRAPKPGDTWKFHLARYDYSVYLEAGVELSSTTRFTNTRGSYFHRFEDWQILKFQK